MTRSGRGAVIDLWQVGPAYVERDLATIIELLPRMSDRRADFISRLCSLLNDHATGIGRDDLRRLLERAQHQKAALIEAEAHRSIGLMDLGADQLRAAADIVERAGSIVRAARIHHELGTVSGDAALAERGLSELEQLGDVDQLERYLVRRRATSSA